MIDLRSLWDSIAVIDDIEPASPGLDDYGIMAVDPVNDRVDMWLSGFEAIEEAKRG